MVDHFIPEVLVARSCRWIRVTRTLRTRLDAHKILGLPVLLRMSGGTLYPRGPCCPFLPLDKGHEDSGNEIAWPASEKTRSFPFSRLLARRNASSASEIVVAPKWRRFVLFPGLDQSIAIRVIINFLQLSLPVFSFTPGFTLHQQRQFVKCWWRYWWFSSMLQKLVCLHEQHQKITGYRAGRKKRSLGQQYVHHKIVQGVEWILLSIPLAFT